MPHLLAKIITIVGTTATGKTQLALDLANWWLTLDTESTNVTGVDIISADSRQIYSGLQTISGADIPAEYQAVELTATTWEQWAQLDPSVQLALSQTWQHVISPQSPQPTDITLWGVACLPVTQSWSAGQFQVFGQLILHRAQQLNRAVIIVGGTGLYHQLLWQKDWQVSVQPDVKLRQAAATATVQELQDWLKKQAPQRFASLNPSDVANPRRLIRHLELAQALPSATDASIPAVATSKPSNPDLTIGLTRELAELPDLIAARVQARWHAGAQTEAAALDPTTVQATVLTTLGVKELLLAASDQLSAGEAQSLWAQRESQYAKRQLTWWKNRPGIHWFPTNQPGLLNRVTSLIIK